MSRRSPIFRGLHHRRDSQRHTCTYLCISTRLRPTRLTAIAFQMLVLQPLAVVLARKAALTIQV